MTNNNDICLANDNSNHRYFIFRTVDIFEPITLEDLNVDMQLPMNYKAPILYEKVEYAISGCNCGNAIKQVVKKQ